MVSIRLANRDDASALLAIYKPYIINTTVTFEEVVPSSADFAERIQRTTEKYPWLICEIDDAVAGYGYATDHRERASYRWTKEVSVYIHPDFRRRKIANGLYTTLIGLLRLQGVKNVLAGITQPNSESVGFHESFGFRKVGVYSAIGYKLGQWCDVGWWELRLDESYDEPSTLKRIEEIAKSPEWARCVDEGVRMIAT